VRKKSASGGFDGRYTLGDLHKWLKSFLERFFANQFKRTCLPEGRRWARSACPARRLADALGSQPALWLKDLEEMYEKLKGS